MSAYARHVKLIRRGGGGLNCKRGGRAEVDPTYHHVNLLLCAPLDMLSGGGLHSACLASSLKPAVAADRAEPRAWRVNDARVRFRAGLGAITQCTRWRFDWIRRQYEAICSARRVISASSRSA